MHNHTSMLWCKRRVRVMSTGHNSTPDRDARAPVKRHTSSFVHAPRRETSRVTVTCTCTSRHRKQSERQFAFARIRTGKWTDPGRGTGAVPSTTTGDLSRAYAAVLRALNGRADAVSASDVSDADLDTITASLRAQINYTQADTLATEMLRSSNLNAYVQSLRAQDDSSVLLNPHTYNTVVAAPVMQYEVLMSSDAYKHLLAATLSAVHGRHSGRDVSRSQLHERTVDASGQHGACQPATRRGVSSCVQQLLAIRRRGSSNDRSRGRWDACIGHHALYRGVPSLPTAPEALQCS